MKFDDNKLNSININKKVFKKSFSLFYQKYFSIKEYKINFFIEILLISSLKTY